MNARLLRGLSHLAVVVCLGITACGGGGGGATPAPAAPAMTLRVQPVKLFQFSWADVSGATEYRLLEAPDANAAYGQVAIIAPGVGQHELTVSLPQRINARYLLQACNTAGCTDSAPVAVSGTLEAGVGYVKASNAGESDFFGGPINFSATPVALSADGMTLAVGAMGESSSATGVDGAQADDSMRGSGAVYVFRRQGSNWAQQAYLKASNTDASDTFGNSLALSADGSTLAVGAFWEASNATGIDGDQSNNLALRSGAVYVFTSSAQVWSQQAYVKASNAEAGDGFGFSLALSGDGSTLAVGAYREGSAATGIDGNQADNSAAMSGAVYVFTRSGTAWSQQAYVKASNTGAGDDFGRSLSLSADGSTLAVGAAFESSSATGIDGDQASNSASGSGAAYVFTRSGTTWSQQAYLKASNTNANDTFGGSLALSADGNTLAVGAFRESSNATGVGGDQSDNSAALSGAVYVFTRSGATWSQQAYVKASNTAAGDDFGIALALSADGNTLAVGADQEDSSAVGIGGNQGDDSAPGSGAVYLFTRNGASWSQRAYLKASNTNGNDRFGVALALNGDGSTLAVSAIYESSSATGIGGNQSDNTAGSGGAVYLY